MKAYHIDRFGSIGGIVRRSAEDPRPGPKEVLMRVRASSLNYHDLMVLKDAELDTTARDDIQIWNAANTNILCLAMSPRP